MVNKRKKSCRNIDNTSINTKVKKVRKQIWFYILSFSVSLISACSGGLSGKYIGNRIEMEFVSGSKVIVTVLRNTFEVEYEKDGDRIKLKSTNPSVDNQILTIDEQGCLNGAGDKLCKEVK